MATDIKRTFYGHSDVQPIATGSQVAEEGQGLIAVLEDGIEKVKPSAGAGGEVFVGFALFRQVDVTNYPNVEELTVPSAAPYDVELEKNNLITGQIRVYDVAAASDLTVVGGAPANATEVQVDYTNGKLTFHSGAADKAMVAYYRYQLTVYESKNIFYDAPTNYPDPNYFKTVGVGKGKGRLFTSFYDQSKVYDGSSALKLGANGIITVGGAGPAIPGGRVVKVPTSSDPMLGIEFIV